MIPAYRLNPDPISAPEPAEVPAVLFDLDGTLVDPAGGITGGLSHALRVLGLPVPEATVLEAMIGPKLADALLGHTAASPHQIPELISIYRRWYSETGITMGHLYSGIAEVLDRLAEAGIRVGVATQKPQSLARKVLESHGIAGYFDVIAGAPDDESIMPGQLGYRRGKAEIIKQALSTLDTRLAIMVGDRAQDVIGAAANHIPCLGAGWGFALPGELERAGSTIVVDHPAELLPELRQLGA